MKASYLAKRILSAGVIMLAVATIVFLAMRVIPSDPAQVVLGTYATEEALQAFRREMGLDQPLWRQYLDFIGNLVQGDLGRSMITNRPIAEQIWALFPYTFNLAISSTIIGAFIGIPLGVWAAIRKNTAVDYVSRIVALAGFSFPAFYLGIVLLLVFSVELGWFPVIHQVRTGTLSEHLHKLVLPALSLGLIQASYVTRLTRSSMLEALNEDYVRTAFAKGLRPRTVHFKHVLKNIMIPVVTAIGISHVAQYIRLARGPTMAIRNLDFVRATRALGAGDLRIMFSQILPNIIGPIIIMGTLSIAGAIRMEASLNFLGFGIHRHDRTGRESFTSSGHPSRSFESGRQPFLHCAVRLNRVI